MTKKWKYEGEKLYVKTKEQAVFAIAQGTV